MPFYKIIFLWEISVHPEEYNRYSWLALSSGVAAGFMDDSWRRPVRHNRELERGALWGAMHTALTSMELGQSDLPLLEFAGEVATRYDIQSAIHTIPTLVPFDTPELMKLKSAGTRSDAWFQCDLRSNGIRGVADKEPELTNRWHSWLWTKDAVVKRGDAPSVEAQMLREGCDRLASAIHSLLEGYHSAPD